VSGFSWVNRPCGHGDGHSLSWVSAQENPSSQSSSRFSVVCVVECEVGRLVGIDGPDSAYSASGAVVVTWYAYRFFLSSRTVVVPCTCAPFPNPH
jgi:hypothetical protein